VEEEEVGDFVEALEGLIVVDADGFVCEVAAGGDDGGWEESGEEGVEGGVGDHHAEEGVAWGDSRGEIGVVFDEDDGGLRGVEERFGVMGEHHGEGLGGALFALAESFNGGLVAGVADEVEAADTFEGEDAAVADGLRGLLEGFVAMGQGLLGGAQFELRPAVGAAVGLGVEAAVGGVAVFGLTGGTEGEVAHGGEGTVVGEAFDDGIAGAAEGAGGEGVEVAAVAGIANVFEAGGADGEIREEEGVGRAGGIAVADFEGGGGLVGDGLGGERGDDGVGGGMGAELGFEGADGNRGALDFDEDALGGIEDKAGEAGMGGGAVDVGTEAHSLNGAGDAEAEAQI
jgi:hypothetical protein